MPVISLKSDDFGRIIRMLTDDVDKYQAAINMANQGEPNIIKKVGGKDDVRSFLEKLGFVVGGTVTVVSETNGNLIVNVKDSRVAIGKEMANKIMV